MTFYRGQRVEYKCVRDEWWQAKLVCLTTEFKDTFPGEKIWYIERNGHRQIVGEENLRPVSPLYELAEQAE